MTQPNAPSAGMFYKLDEHGEPYAVSQEQWGEWRFRAAGISVRVTKVGERSGVSTVFLGINADLTTPPTLWASVVFLYGEPVRTERYQSRQAADDAHDGLCEWLRTRIGSPTGSP